MSAMAVAPEVTIPAGMTELVPGTIVELDGRFATVVCATDFGLKPSRFVQFEDGSCAQVVRAPGRTTFALTVVADDSDLRYRTRIVNIIMARGVKVDLDRWVRLSRDPHEAPRAMAVRIMHVGDCPDGVSEPFRPTQTDIAHMVTPATSRSRDLVMFKFAKCITGMVGIGPDVRDPYEGIPITGLAGATCTYGGSRCTILDETRRNYEVVLRPVSGRGKAVRVDVMKIREVVFPHA